MQNKPTVNWKSWMILCLPALLYVLLGYILRLILHTLPIGDDAVAGLCAVILIVLSLPLYRAYGVKEKTQNFSPLSPILWLLSALAIGLCTGIFPGLQEATLTTMLAILGYGIMAPIAEEVVYRGLILQYGEKKFGFWPALMVSAILFAVAHVQPARMIAALIFGILLGLLQNRYRTIWAPIIVHVTVNLLSFVLPTNIPLLCGVFGVVTLITLSVYFVSPRHRNNDK